MSTNVAPFFRRAALGTLLTCCLSSPVLAQTIKHHSQAPKPTVSPMDELQILDPSVDPEGKPRPLVVPGGNGELQIQIPPTVIVHRFYYTGDRDFQGPMIQGGPMIFAVNNPATGEQEYVDVLLPPGAPRIKYRRDRIVYEYRDRAITVAFGHPGLSGKGKHARTTVSIKHHCPIRKDVERQREAKQEESRALWARTGIPEAKAQVKQSSHEVVGVAADAVQFVGKTATAPVIAIWQATPLSKLNNAEVKQPAFNEPGVR